MNTQDTSPFSSLRLLHIQALERRAAAQTGELRALLEQRLAELAGAYARDIETAPAIDHRSPPRVTPSQAPRNPLTALVEQLTGVVARDAIADSALAAAAPAPTTSASAFAVLDEIRQTCTKVRNQSQLRQALDSAPDDAGPLNSANLVHRALTRMQALSPAYLQHFIAYVDALSALEPFRAQAARAEEKPARGSRTGKRMGTRSRKRSA